MFEADAVSQAYSYICEHDRSVRNECKMQMLTTVGAYKLPYYGLSLVISASRISPELEKRVSFDRIAAVNCAVMPALHLVCAVGVKISREKEVKKR